MDEARGGPRANALDRARIDEGFIFAGIEVASVRLSRAIAVHGQNEEAWETGGRWRWGTDDGGVGLRRLW